MNLTNIRSFYTIVINNSISKAARELHLSQPGLSMQLQCLENELGFKLLNRSNRGVELTKEGKLVFEFAQSMLSLQDSLQRNLDELKKEKDTLSLSCCKNIGEQILPCSIYTFKEIHINVDVSMDISNSKDIVKKLLNHETNIGIIQEMDDVPDSIELIPFMSDELVLISGKDSKYSSISTNELTSIPLILREENSSTVATINKFLNTINLSISNLNVLLSLNSPESIKSSIISGRGYSWLPKLTLTHELRSKTIKIIDTPGLEMPFKYYIAIRKNYTLSSCEENFISFLTSNRRCFCY